MENMGLPRKSPSKTRTKRKLPDVNHGSGSSPAQQPVWEGIEQYDSAPQNKKLRSSNPSPQKNETLPNDDGILEAMAKDWDGKRRIIIWSHQIKKDSCRERAEELIQLIKQYDRKREQWRPQYYFLRKDTGKEDTETCKSMKPLWDRARETNVLDNGLSLQKLEVLLQENLHNLSCNTETIMIMTESKKDNFGAVVKTLTDTTVKLDKPPFVALLERTEEGGPWSETCLLQPNKWKLEKLLGSYGDIGATAGDTGATAPVTPPKIKEHSKTTKKKPFNFHK